MNSPIPSLLLPLWQSESLCETIGVKIWCHLYSHWHGNQVIFMILMRNVLQKHSFCKWKLTRWKLKSAYTLFCFIRILFFRPRLNIRIFLPILGWKHSNPGPRGYSWYFTAWESCERAAEAANTSREAARKKNLWLLWTWISLSCRRQGQDLTLELGLVDIFTNTEINTIGPFDWQYRGDGGDNCYCTHCVYITNRENNLILAKCCSS